ncbi:MAG: preprotein translocase subunit SecE [Verrucomicrobia bacterium]|jgi:preprotein translocase subunit SecE|nr:preprotein translocase subunit SecE [Verrucomicrobiota bacterium]
MGETNTELAVVVNEVANAAASSPTFWDNYGATLIWVCVISAVFAFLWYKGQLTRFSNYVQLTREELRKCSWPTWTELKGSTVVIAISILLLGGFTVVVDFIFTRVLMLLS